MQLTDFDYELAENLIAQEPATPRETSRMLIVNRAANTLCDERFEAFPNCLSAGDVLVLNNTRVFPARLYGVSETGAKIEIFLVSKVSDRVWEALARPARRLRTGKEVSFGGLSGTIRDNLGDGRVLIEFSYEGEFQEILDRIGKTPLPPYIKRSAAATDDDRDRYQTVYAKTSGAIAAPTAGLHFTEHVLERMREGGVQIVEITLHVGYGTFEPVRAEDLSRHSVLPERFEISELAADALNAARRDRRRIVAVGTTTTRALESVISKHREFVPGSGTADLTVTPGYEFKSVDALLTNFHLPRSSLLILVSTFGGHKLIMEAYKHAVTERYRFYSYGDCMFIN